MFEIIIGMAVVIFSFYFFWNIVIDLLENL